MMSKQWRILAGIVAGVLALAGGWYAYELKFGLGPTKTITAQFVRTPGLYKGNAVSILGVRTGVITAMTTRDGYVEVKMAIPKDTKIPSDVKAILEAPNPVSDRVVELLPAYKGGAELPAGAVIPLERTIVPLELDEIFANVSKIATTLGPSGVNDTGSLNDALAAVAKLVDGKGEDFRHTLDAVARALPAITNDPVKLKTLIASLDRITATLAAHRNDINALYDGLADVTHQMAGEKQALAGAITNLDAALGEVTQFVESNKDKIGVSVQNLETTARALLAQKQAMIDTFDVLPLTFQNVNNAIVLNGPCPGGTKKTGNCAGIFGRLNYTAGVEPRIDQYCGGFQLNLLAILGTQVQIPGVLEAKNTDLLCAATYGFMQGHPGSPALPATPDFGLAQFLGR